MGEVLGWGDEMAREIVPSLPGVVASAVAMYDSVIEGLVTFVQEYPHDNATISDIVDWAQSDPESRFTNIKSFQNSILLGRYFKAHEYDIQQSTGIEITRKHNVTTLRMPGGTEK
jgi:phosphoglycerate-specific signal transduction histidine kinase